MTGSAEIALASTGFGTGRRGYYPHSGLVNILNKGWRIVQSCETAKERQCSCTKIMIRDSYILQWHVGGSALFFATVPATCTQTTQVYCNYTAESLRYLRQNVIIASLSNRWNINILQHWFHGTFSIRGVFVSSLNTLNDRCSGVGPNIAKHCKKF